MKDKKNHFEYNQKKNNHNNHEKHKHNSEEKINKTIKELEQINAELVLKNKDLEAQNQKFIEEVSQLRTKIYMSDEEYKNKINQIQKDAQIKMQAKIEELVNLKVNKIENDNKDLTNKKIRNILRDLLTPLNHYIKAIEFAQNSSNLEIANWAKGFAMLENQFWNVFLDNGANIIKPEVGSLFDSHTQKITDKIETDEYPHETILAVNSVGAELNGILIEPASVKVSIKKNNKFSK